MVSDLIAQRTRTLAFDFFFVLFVTRTVLTSSTFTNMRSLSCLLLYLVYCLLLYLECCVLLYLEYCFFFSFFFLLIFFSQAAMTLGHEQHRRQILATSLYLLQLSRLRARRVTAFNVFVANCQISRHKCIVYSGLATARWRRAHGSTCFAAWRIAIVALRPARIIVRAAQGLCNHRLRLIRKTCLHLWASEAKQQVWVRHDMQCVIDGRRRWWVLRGWRGEVVLGKLRLKTLALRLSRVFDRLRKYTLTRRQQYVCRRRAAVKRTHLLRRKTMRILFFWRRLSMQSVRMRRLLGGLQVRRCCALGHVTFRVWASAASLALVHTQTYKYVCM